MTSALHRHLPQVRDSLPSDLLASLPTSSQYSWLHLAQPVLDGGCYTLLNLDKTCADNASTVIDWLNLGFVATGLLSWHRAFWQHNAPQQYISCWQGKNKVFTLSPPRKESLHFIISLLKLSFLVFWSAPAPAVGQDRGCSQQSRSGAVLPSVHNVSHRFTFYKTPRIWCYRSHNKKDCTSEGICRSSSAPTWTDLNTY